MEKEINKAKKKLIICHINFSLMFWTLISLGGLIACGYETFFKNNVHLNYHWNISEWMNYFLHNMTILMWIIFGIALVVFVAQIISNLVVFFSIAFFTAEKYKTQAVIYCFLGIFLMPFVTWMGTLMARTCFAVKLEQLKAQQEKNDK